jgi:hypothetical protein
MQKILTSECVRHDASKSASQGRVLLEFSAIEICDNIDFLVKQLATAEGAQRRILLYNIETHMQEMRARISGGKIKTFS